MFVTRGRLVCGTVLATTILALGVAQARVGPQWRNPGSSIGPAVALALPLSPNCIKRLSRDTVWVHSGLFPGTRLWCLQAPAPPAYQVPPILTNDPARPSRL
jgi:hypothetical protein